VFGIEAATSGRHLVVAVRGDVDIATAPALRDALADAVKRSAAVVVDLADVPFLDSTGLGVLVAAANRARAGGRTLVIARPRQIVRNALRLVQVDTVIDVYDSLDDALAVPSG
jgi:anti-sigma B factor antagonist